MEDAGAKIKHGDPSHGGRDRARKIQAVPRVLTIRDTMTLRPRGRRPGGVPQEHR